MSGRRHELPEEAAGDRDAALEYHARAPAGKLGTHVTKPCATQYELGLAYSPGVAWPVRAIARDPEDAFRYTNRGNLVGVVSNGTAVLGLGDVGPLAGKPVMEGKGVLFKKFAGIDVFDIEVDAEDVDTFVDTVARIAVTFGGINLEDIAAPACFDIESQLAERVSIPVFHDDQHGTAIIVAAGLLNALELQGKRLDEARMVCLGAGAAGIASMRLLLAMGARRENVLLVDRRGVIHEERTDLNRWKRALAAPTELRTLEEALDGANVFVGVSGPDTVTPDMVRSLAPRPVLFALSNPDPEITPEAVREVRDDAIIATGRSDYPNQVNNVLGFPFIFRGALDVRAMAINETMQIAAVKALRALARESVPQEVLEAYDLERLEFGPEYILPKPLDARLRERVPPAVAAAAVRSGVARAGYPPHYPEAPADDPHA